MIYRSTGRVDVGVSAIGLGGHEYLPDGRSRGFNENANLAVTPGYLYEGFGQEKRKAVLAAAYEHGINLLDATIDSEKEALGRNLSEMPPPYEVYVQTRPEGMVYSYDPHNARLARYDLLQAEVARGLDLLGRTRLDFLNLGFLQGALDHDPDYLRKVAEGLARLKREGLIRYACADTFSGEGTYLRQIEQDCFDGIFINLNFADDGAVGKVLPAAADRGMAVFAREAFMKGALFRMGEEAGIVDRNSLARTALKWVLSQRQVTAVMVGVDTPEQLASNVSVLDDPEMAAEELSILERVRETASYRDYVAGKREQFGQ